ncbi:MAG: hypothetical protein AB9856_03890 [Cellulosilyticaceae bacterium]
MEETLKLILNELKNVNARLYDLEADQKEIKSEVKEINRKTDIIFNQTAGLTEFTTSTTSSLSNIENQLGAIEKVTAKNCYDITHLKMIK